MRKIHERSSQMAANFQDRALVRALRKGTKGMREAATQFLPRSRGEKPYKLQDGTEFDPYQDRLKKSFLFNATKRTVQTLTGKPFSKELTASTESTRGQAYLEKWIGNIDGNGSDFHEFGRKVFIEGMWNGMGHIMADAPKEGKEPYLAFYHPDKVMQADEIDGELVILCLAETYKRMAADGMSVEEVKRERRYRKFNGMVEWALFEEGDNGEPVQTSEWAVFGLDYIPFFTFYADPDGSSDFMTCEPPIQDLADTNCKHWMKDSDLDNIEHVANVPFLFGRGFEDEKEIRIGHDSMVIGDTDGSDVKYVEHQGHAIGKSQESIKNVELRMQALGLEFMTLKSGSETATGRSLQAQGTNSALASMAVSLAKTLERALSTMAEYVLIDDMAASVEIHTDYGVTMSTEELQALNSARQLGDLSQEDYLAELKRRGVLRTGFDFDANADRLAAELDAA